MLCRRQKVTGKSAIKKLKQIDQVLITSSHHPSEVVRQEYYVLTGMEPDINTLPWIEDLTPKQRKNIELG
ncbi:MAG: hypothetical protein AAED33_06345 [Paracoccaceae bacterium]